MGGRNFHDPAEIYGLILCGEEFPPTEFSLEVMRVPEKGRKLFTTPAAGWDNKAKEDVHFGKGVGGGGKSRIWLIVQSQNMSLWSKQS